MLHEQKSAKLISRPRSSSSLVSIKYFSHFKARFQDALFELSPEDFLVRTVGETLDIHSERGKLNGLLWHTTEGNAGEAGSSFEQTAYDQHWTTRGNICI